MKIKDLIKGWEGTALFEILLVLCATIAFAHSIGLTSAYSAQDLTSGASTCLKSKDGKTCQEYLASECDTLCNEKCIQTAREYVSECKLGTCFDGVEGTCQGGSPKYSCESNGGQWFNDAFENIPQCSKGCCVIKDQTYFANEKSCERKGEVLGIESVFKPEIKTEIECLALAKSQEEGACAIEKLNDNGLLERTCKFAARQECSGVGGDFYSGYLCSNPELNTTCTKQKTAKCIDGRDEIYWFDSCGNKENIYSVDKTKSWNSGKVLSKVESCSLDSAGNNLANQKTCGNCEYILGNICGTKTPKEKLADSSIDVVCRDLSCVDENGKRREHGESWCVYQGEIGAEKDSLGQFLRGKDTPGSRYFKKICFDGKINIEPCQEYRNELCIEESASGSNGRKISNAACVMNPWQECLAFNKNYDSANAAPLEKDKCEKNPYCAIKEVDLTSDKDDTFKFSMCVPKYPAGFDVRSNGAAGEALCKLGKMKCTYVEKKSLGGDWNCKINCDCKNAEFAEKMNNFCMSLGDCGASVNYIGSYTKNYRTYGDESPQVSSDYVKKLKEYSDTKKGQGIDAKEIVKYIGETYGFASDFSKPGIENTKNDFMKISMITSGAIGVPLLIAKYVLPKALSAALFSGGSKAASTAVIKAGPAGAISTAPYITAAMGASIGMTVVSVLGMFLGEAVPKEALYSMMALGAVGGAMIYLGIFAKIGGATLWGPGLAILIAVIIVEIIGIITGWGKTRERVVAFDCQPWQAPTGGAYCKKCGSDGLPCSPYSCHTLGQTCEFLNSGTGKEVCVDVNPNDASAPVVVSPLDRILSEGIKYSEFNSNGMKVVSNFSDGCIKEYAKVGFGFTLNEVGQCVYSLKHVEKFGDADLGYVGESNLFKKEHEAVVRMPGLSELGITGFDPKRRGVFNLYVRCQDARGNQNIKEFAIGMCVMPAEDITPPLILSREPKTEYTKFNATTLNGAVYTNEPAECRWSKDNQDYELMSNNFVCLNKISEETFGGFKCFGNFSVNANSSINYVRCKDQPWLANSSEENKRNSNKESYKFIIKRSSSALNVKLKPNNETLSFGIEPVTIQLEAETSGGMNDKAVCSYNFGGRAIEFSTTGDRTHKQIFSQFTSGNKEILVKCEDDAGNIIEKTAKFKVEIDNNAPIITRVYNNAGSLVVITDEDSRCYYNKQNCEFKDVNSSEMLGTGVVHSTSLQKESKYFIRCADKFGNTHGSCGMIIGGVI